MATRPHPLHRKETRSHTLPTQSSSQRASIESPNDLRKVIAPPPGFAAPKESAESNPFELVLHEFPSPESEIQVLTSKIDYFKEENEKLHSLILKQKSGYSVDEILSSLSINTKVCTDKKSYQILKEQNYQLMKSYYELYQDYRKLLDSQYPNGSEDLNLREEMRALKMTHSEEISKIVAGLEKVKEDLQERHISELISYKTKIELYETALHNLQSRMKDRAPDLLTHVPVPECEECLKKQELLERLPNDNAIKLIETSIYPATKHLNALTALTKDLETSSNSFDPVFRKKMKELRSILHQIAEEKPQQMKSARSKRIEIHQTVLAIEQAFEQLRLPTKEMLDIKTKFLELPFLIKPLFELTKSYEMEVPMFVTDALSGADHMYKLLCKVAERSHGVLRVEDIEFNLQECERLKKELRDTKAKLTKYERIKESIY